MAYWLKIYSGGQWHTYPSPIIGAEKAWRIMCSIRKRLHRPVRIQRLATKESGL